MKCTYVLAFFQDCLLLSLSWNIGAFKLELKETIILLGLKGKCFHKILKKIIDIQNLISVHQYLPGTFTTEQI